MAWSDGLAKGTPAYAIAASLNPRVRVVAGPGTGKSFAMKRRVARLLESGVNPKTILPVTFTRVAAEDLHRELVGMGVPGCDELKGQTLHSLAMRMLMRNHVLATTGRTARPLNDFELEPLICDLMQSHGGKKIIKKRKQAYEAAWARLQQDTPGVAPSPEDAAFASNLVAWLVFHNAMLIGEVIPQLYKYLHSNPAAPERAEFAHILVDEFQDLNKAEQALVELLSDKAAVCIVGDDDQSIYSFKHAHPEGIRDWLVVNGGADDLNLDECRRCPARVARIANSLIAKNKMRLVPRALVPMESNGEGDVRIIQYQTLDGEVVGITNIITGLIKKGVPPGDILVLAQRGAIGTPIYDSLRLNAVPVRSYYAEAELDKIEAQRRFAVLKLFVNPQDKVALRWLIGLPGSNWNAAGYRRVREHCAATGHAPWQVLEQLSAGVLQLGHTQNIVAAFNEVAGELAALEECPDLSAVIDSIFPEDNASVIDLRRLALEALGEVAENDRAALLSALVESITQPEIPSEIQDVRIMSLHKSKGLSAPVTIVAGCVEGLLPKQPKPETPLDEVAADIEEQRRLFFVGISRVKAAPLQGKIGTLILTYSRHMSTASAKGAGIEPANTAFGVATLHASRFIDELGPHAPVPIAG
ncbi:MAG TPA: ATP-dependent helicase [Pseudolabrys sp.]|nr:ATP-dependent helicase [Pseudolabrys sp.]